jgi:hypothetical protein
MSRGLALFTLIAILTTPLITLAHSAEGLTASLEEQSEPGVIDPVDSPPDDLGSIVADPASACFASLALEPIAFAGWIGSADLARFHVVRSARTLETPVWPTPSRKRRLSWLQSLLI